MYASKTNAFHAPCIPAQRRATERTKERFEPPANVRMARPCLPLSVSLCSEPGTCPSYPFRSEWLSPAAIFMRSLPHRASQSVSHSLYSCPPGTRGSETSAFNGCPPEIFVLAGWRRACQAPGRLEAPVSCVQLPTHTCFVQHPIVTTNTHAETEDVCRLRSVLLLILCKYGQSSYRLSLSGRKNGRKGPFQRPFVSIFWKLAT